MAGPFLGWLSYTYRRARHKKTRAKARGGKWNAVGGWDVAGGWNAASGWDAAGGGMQ
jgi:hypothetical protein